jgi:hypothetical protein
MRSPLATVKNIVRIRNDDQRVDSTHELLLLAAVLDLDIGLALAGQDLEGEVLHVRLHLSVVEATTDETLGVEDGVVRVHRDLVLRGIADETLGLGEGDVGWCGAVALVVGDDLNAVVLPDTDATVTIFVSTPV